MILYESKYVKLLLLIDN